MMTGTPSTTKAPPHLSRPDVSAGFRPRNSSTAAANFLLNCRRPFKRFAGFSTCMAHYLPFQTLTKSPMQPSSQTGYQNFINTTGCHLVIEFPPGSTILLPSAILAHSNVVISSNERHYSFTQYTAGALFRWVEWGFLKTEDFYASLSDDELESQKERDTAVGHMGSLCFRFLNSCCEICFVAKYNRFLPSIARVKL